MPGSDRVQVELFPSIFKKTKQMHRSRLSHKYLCENVASSYTQYQSLHGYASFLIMIHIWCKSENSSLYKDVKVCEFWTDVTPETDCFHVALFPKYVWKNKTNIQIKTFAQVFAWNISLECLQCLDG